MKISFLLILMLFPLMIAAQTEYRLSGIYNGKTDAGLRNIHLDIEVMQGGKYKWVHKCDIITGANLDMATVTSDTNYAARSWSAVMNDAELKAHYTHFMNSFIERIDAADLSKYNTESNSTSNTISLERSSNILTVQVRGIQGDNMCYIDIQSLDNHYFVMYNKPLLQYSANLIDMSTVRLKPADYIVKVSPNAGPSFSGKISIY